MGNKKSILLLVQDYCTIIPIDVSCYFFSKNQSASNFLNRIFIFFALLFLFYFRLCGIPWSFTSDGLCTLHTEQAQVKDLTEKLKKTRVADPNTRLNPDDEFEFGFGRIRMMVANSETVGSEWCLQIRIQSDPDDGCEFGNGRIRMMVANPYYAFGSVWCFGIPDTVGSVYCFRIRLRSDPCDAPGYSRIRMVLLDTVGSIWFMQLSDSVGSVWRMPTRMMLMDPDSVGSVWCFRIRSHHYDTSGFGSISMILPDSVGSVWCFRIRIRLIPF